MSETWYRIEFWSQQSHCWVALFDREPSSAAAEKKAREWLLEAKSRVVKVTQTTETIWESYERSNRKRELVEIAQEAGFDTDNIHVAHAIAALIEPLVDKGTAIDSGGGADSADLWAIIGGVEHYIHIRRSNKQQQEDSANHQGTGQ